ncbi:hypothetical protein [Sphingomonas koreensis]
MTSSGPVSAGTRLPEWLPHRYDPQHDAIHFVGADRALRQKVPFLTDEYLPNAANPQVVRRTEALASTPADAPVHFIFHSAYCCSTLLANVLDRPGTASAVKEPVILNDLVGWRHRGAAPAKVGEMLDHALRLLAHPFEAGEAVIIKPSNVVNALAPAMLSLRPRSRAILLYAPLDHFLASIAGKGLFGRRWVRDLLMKQLKDGVVDLGFGADDYFLHTDLQVAAVGWLVQHKLFADMAVRWPDRVRTLDSEVLMARPHEVLQATAGLFGLKLDAAAVSQMIASDAFTRNAKDGARYGSADRSAARASNATLHADEIGKVTVWAEAVAGAAGLDMRAAAPLLPAA